MTNHSLRLSAPAARPPLLRILWWDREMSAARYPSLADCCEAFEISERTARRDLEFLRDRMDAPCAYDRRRNGYYYTETGFSLPAVRLSQGELIVLFLAQKVFEQYHGTPYAAQIAAAFEKIRAALPTEVSLDLGSLNNALSFNLGPSRDVEPATFTLLEKAVRERRRLDMTYYTPARDELTTRRVDPLHLHAAGSDLYLIAFCHLRGEVREFALSRIRGLKETGERFTLPEGFDRDAWLHESFGLIRGGIPQDVALEFDPLMARWVRERVWHHTQCLEELKDGRLVVRLTVPVAADLVAWVLSYGSRCRVLGPEELRDRVCSEASRILDRMAAE